MAGKRKRSTGVMITDKKVFAAQVETGPQGLEISKLVSADIPEGIIDSGVIINAKRMAHIIKDLFKHNDLSSKNVGASIYDSQTVVRAIGLSNTSGPEFRKALQEEAQKYMMFGEEAVVDGYTISKGEVFMVAMRKSSIKSLLAAFDKSGIRLNSIDMPFLAALRSTNSECGGNLNLNSKKAVMAVVCHPDGTDTFVINGGVPVYARKLTPSDISELGREIIMTSTYWEEQFPGIVLEKIVIFGDASKAKALDLELSNNNVSAEQAQVFGKVSTDHNFSRSVAAGLAVKTLEEREYGFEINLLPDDRVRRVLLEKRFMISFIAVISVIFVYFLASFVLDGMADSYKKKMNNIEENFTKQIDVLSEVEKLNQRRVDAINIWNTREKFLSQKGRKNWPAILGDISKYIPKEVWIAEMISQKNDSLILNGKSYDQNAIYRYVEFLELCEDINEPELSFIEGKDEKGVFEFSIICFSGDSKE
ncbi:MAG: pilus assembly protein PilM [Candidatus Aadella gelida]|nr:pilus assembly protein PilM [Candidatus Aadella gelida]